jgi:ribosomal protein L20
VDSVTTADPRYMPSNARREARKLATQALYEAWRKAYRDLKKQHRNMTGVWYSRRIEKMDIANERSAETIRKHMKK